MHWRAKLRLDRLAASPPTHRQPLRPPFSCEPFSPRPGSCSPGSRHRQASELTPEQEILTRLWPATHPTAPPVPDYPWPQVRCLIVIVDRRTEYDGQRPHKAGVRACQACKHMAKSRLRAGRSQDNGNRIDYVVTPGLTGCQTDRELIPNGDSRNRCKARRLASLDVSRSLSRSP